MRRLSRFVAVVLLVALISLSGVFAWGLDPARQRAKVSSGMQYLEVSLENPQGSEGYFKVSFTGDLAHYADYKGPLIYLGSDDAQYTVPFSLSLPDDLLPGKHLLSVNLEQIPGGSSSTVSSLVVLAADVVVDVPLGGTHVDARLSVGAAGPDDDTPFTLSVINLGEKEVAVWADVVIKGPTNQELDSWQTSKQVIPFKGAGKISTSWSGEKETGVYFAEVALHYGDEVRVLRQTFMVGAKEVVVDDIGSDDFSLGRIVPLDVVLRNKWNGPVDDVFAEVFVLSGSGSILQSFKSASERLRPLDRVNLTAYWDTARLVAGSYDLNVVVHYDGGQSQRSFPVTVSADDLQVKGVPTGELSAAASGGGGPDALLVLLLVVLLVTNVIIIAYFRRSRKT